MLNTDKRNLFRPQNDRNPKRTFSIESYTSCCSWAIKPHYTLVTHEATAKGIFYPKCLRQIGRASCRERV